MGLTFLSPFLSPLPERPELSDEQQSQLVEKMIKRLVMKGIPRWEEVGNVHALVQLETLSGMFRRSASVNVPRFVISRCLPSQIYVHICRICLVGSIEGFSPESEAFLHDPLHEEIHQSKTEQHYDFRCEICI